MRCVSNSWVLRSASQSLPPLLLTAFIALLLALRAFRRLLPLSLRKHAQRASKPAPSASYVPLGAIPVHPSAHQQQPPDDWDPDHDDWTLWLDEPYVIDACRPHLLRCYLRDSARHDHP